MQPGWMPYGMAQAPPYQPAAYPGYPYGYGGMVQPAGYRPAPYAGYGYGPAPVPAAPQPNMPYYWNGGAGW
jgi:hypothetical protein